MLTRPEVIERLCRLMGETNAELTNFRVMETSG